MTRGVRRAVAPLLICLAAVGALPLRAQEPRDLTAVSLEELASTKVTTVSKEETPLFRTPAAIQVLTADDIRRAGAMGFAEALRSVPGLNVSRINSSQWGIGIRGPAARLSRSQLVLMDGRSLYTPLFAGTYWEVQDTILEDVERVEVVRGPGGTLWGANAVNGIVNIITKDASATQGGFVVLGGGTEERAFTRGRHGGRISDRGHYRVYGKYADHDAGFHADGRDFDAWHLAQGGFRTDWARPAGGHLTVQGDAYAGRAGERSSLSFYEPPFSRVVEQRSELSGGNLTTRWDRPWGGSRVTLSGYYDRTRRAQANFREVRDTVDLEGQHQFRLGRRQQIVWGTGYRLSSGRTGGSETVAFVPAERVDHIFSAFLQDNVALAGDRVQLSLGTKLERNQYTGFELQPSARVLWAPAGPRHAAWAAVTRAVRTPSRLERDLSLTGAQSATAPLFVRLQGNDDFHSEETVAYEAGYRVRPTDRLSLDLAVFHNRYSDLLSLELGLPFAEGPRRVVPYGFGNALRGRATGLELAAAARLPGSWAVSAEYSYLSVDLEARPGSADTTSAASGEASPRHVVGVRSSWRIASELDLDLALRRIGAIASSVPAYSSLNARAAWRATPRLELAVVGQNLLDRHHLEAGGTSPTEVERSVYGEARWRW